LQFIDCPSSTVAMIKEDRQGNINNATKSNGDSKDANSNFNSTSSLATEHVEWALKKIAVRAKITMPGFANDFGFYSEQDAHTAFSNLLLSTNLSEATRLRLQETYKVWRGNHGMVFWANKVASLQTTITLKRTAGEVVAGTQRIAKKLILEEANNLVHSFTDSEADDSSNTLGALPSAPDETHMCSPWATSPSTGIDTLDSEENRPTASPLPRRCHLQDSDVTAGDNTTNSIQTDHQRAHPEDEQASDLANGDDSLDLEEIDDLVALITSVKHKECDKWVLDDRCVPCMVDDYKESAIEALRARELTKTEPADIMILAGTFAPWSPTARMTKIFPKQCLKKIRGSLTKKVDAIDIEDASILRSIRHRTNSELEEAVEALDDVKNKRLRRLFQQ
ncbi:hypothetical protein BGZ95_007156, partial [Linnemannia exigua]